MLNQHSDEEPVRGSGDRSALQALWDLSLSAGMRLLGADAASRVRALGELARQGVLGGADRNVIRLQAISELRDLASGLRGREDELRVKLGSGTSGGIPFAQPFFVEASQDPSAGPTAAIERVGAHWMTRAQQSLGQMLIETQQSASAAIKVREKVNEGVAEVSLAQVDLARLREAMEKELPAWIHECTVDAEADWTAEMSALLALPPGPPAPIELPPASLKAPPPTRLALPSVWADVGASIRSSRVLQSMVGAGTLAIIASLAKTQESFGSSPPGYLYVGVLLPTAFVMAWIDSSRDRDARWREKLATVRSKYDSVMRAQIVQAFACQRAKLLAWIGERQRQWTSALHEFIAPTPKGASPEAGSKSPSVMPATRPGAARLLQELRELVEMRSAFLNIQTRLREEADAQVGLD